MKIRKLPRRLFVVAALLLCVVSASAAPFFRFAPLSEEEAEAIQEIAGGFRLDAWFYSLEDLTYNRGKNSRYSFRVRGAEIFDGSPQPDDAADLAADWIVKHLEKSGYKPTEDPYKHTLYSTLTEKVGEFTMRNIVAEKRGSGRNADQVILLTAHYDSIASKTEGWKHNWREYPAPGAIDNATGVAAVLEAARCFAYREFDLSVRFVFFTGEEQGLFGSRHYAENARLNGDNIAGVLNVDMIGFDAEGPLDLHIVANRNGEWLLQTAYEAAQAVQSDLNLQLHRDPKLIYSDHAPFWEEGYSAILFTQDVNSESYPYFHTIDDTVDKVQKWYASEAVPAYIAAAAAAARPLPKGKASEPKRAQITDASVYPNPFRLNGGQPLIVHCQLSEPARITLRLYDSAGRMLHKTSADGQIGLNQLIEWNGRSMNGEPAAPGVYFADVTTECAEGSPSRQTVRLLILPSREP